MSKEKILKIMTYIIMLFFLIIHLIQENFEFIGYLGITYILFLIVLKISEKYEIPFIVLTGFSIWVFLHLLGGTDIAGQRVYSLILINITQAPLYILKYDQIIHLYCYMIVGSMAYIITNKETKKMSKMLLTLAVFTAMGVGAANEIIEFLITLTLPDSGVGDYYNNAFDLVTNTIGATIGVLWTHKYKGKNITPTNN